jgi:hypothetical protein
MRHKGNDCEQKQQVNQSAGHMEHQEAASPHNQQQQSNHKEGSESHYRLLNELFKLQSSAKLLTVYIAGGKKTISAENCKSRKRC